MTSEKRIPLGEPRSGTDKAETEDTVNMCVAEHTECASVSKCSVSTARYHSSDYFLL